MPFVLKAGKALNERKAEIRVQLRATPHFVFGGEPESMRNEVGSTATAGCCTPERPQNAGVLPRGLPGATV